MSNLDKRAQIIQSLIKWRQSYQLFHYLNNNEEDLNKSIAEITGIKKMSWFLPTIEGDRKIHDDCLQLNFDPFQELKLISDLKNFKNIDEMNIFWDKVESNISVSLFQINLDKFNSAVTENDNLRRRQKLIEMLLTCNNFYLKTHESQKDAYINLAKECRKKDATLNWWCEKWIVQTKEKSVDYSTFPLEFNSLRLEFLNSSIPLSIEDVPYNIDRLLEQYHSKDYIQTVKANNLIRLNYLMLGIFSCLVLTSFTIYFYFKNIENLDENSRILLILALFNIILVIIGIRIIKSINNEKHFYDNRFQDNSVSEFIIDKTPAGTNSSKGLTRF